MPEAIGYASSRSFAPTESVPRSQQVAAQVRELSTQQKTAVAETVQRQAKFSSNRAEALSRQAEQIENRVETRKAQDGLGSRLDLSV